MNNKFLQFLSLIKKSGKIIEGYNKTEELVKKGSIKVVIISEDASENTYKKFYNYSNRYKIYLIKKFTKAQLGQSIGRNEINVIGLSDDSMCKKIIALYEAEVSN